MINALKWSGKHQTARYGINTRFDNVADSNLDELITTVYGKLWPTEARGERESVFVQRNRAWSSWLATCATATRKEIIQKFVK